MRDELTRRRLLASAALVTGGVLVGSGSARAQPPGPRIRKEVRSLSAAELDRLRNAFRELQRKAGDDGYQKLAGRHGEPDNFCHRDESLFLPWHRAYILRFEEALRKIDADVTLPFWEWTSTDSIQNGIPKALADQTYLTTGGQRVPNPLFKARIALPTVGRDTRRSPREPFRLASLASQVSNSFTMTTHLNFNFSLSVPHGGLHTWVRGDMGSVPLAAYDPIFWFHHANVDRQWAQWQLGRNNANPESALMERTLEPFGLKVRDVIDWKNQLKYDYNMIQPRPPRSILLAESGNLQRVENFEFDPARQAVYLFAHDLGPAPESYNVDVFINQPDADANTPAENNPHYAGTFGIFGGSKHALHAAEMKEDGKKTLRILNITSAVSKYARANEKSSLSVKFIVTDMEGRQVDLKNLPLKGFSIQPD